jgi:aconitase A
VWQWLSSAKHAAIAPRYLGLRAVIAESFARIHWQNLANCGVLALEFENPGDYDTIDQRDTLGIQQLRDARSARALGFTGKASYSFPSYWARGGVAREQRSTVRRRR